MKGWIMNMEIDKLKVKDIKPYPNNAKLHPEGQIQQIVNSIREFGFNDPIAIDENNVIIEGHGRYEAAKLLKLKEVPVIKLGHLIPAQIRAYRLAHNKITLNSEFDLSKLRDEFEDLKALEIDIELTGFDLLEVEEMFHEPEFDAESEDEQGRLDERSMVKCPECGHEFKPGK